MKHVSLPDTTPRRLPFYLALEEWVAENLAPDDYFFTWVVDPTVIVGRNQDLMIEVDLDYCRRRGIDVCRRRSGGGCVYADRDNIMMSLVTPDTDVVATFADYTRRVADVLRSMGIDAQPSGRNDITVGDNKISGNAYYLRGNRSIVHGTMLYDTDLDNMSRAITPSTAKLSSKRVSSVASRITTVHRVAPNLSFEAFRTGIIDGMTTKSVTLDATAIAAVESIEQRYYEPAWLLRGGHSDSLRRIAGVGDIALSISLDSAKRIVSFDITGDIFVIGDLVKLRTAMVGACLDTAEIAKRLAGIDIATDYIAGLSTSGFIELIMTAQQTQIHS